MDQLQPFGFLATCPACKAGIDGRQILIEVQGVYDGGLLYQCPDCGAEWPRFSPTHPLHARAVHYLRTRQEWTDGTRT